MHSSFILLQAQAKGPFGDYGTLVMIGLMGVVFYFFMIRPQQKKQKEAKKFMEEIKKGDKVVTSGGIFGRILEITDNSFILELESGSKMKVLKSAISQELSVSGNKMA